MIGLAPHDSLRAIQATVSSLSQGHAVIFKPHNKPQSHVLAQWATQRQAVVSNSKDVVSARAR